MVYLFKFWAIKGRYKISSLQARFWEEFGRQAIKNRNLPYAEIARKKLSEINKKKDHLISKIEDLLAK